MMVAYLDATFSCQGPGFSQARKERFERLGTASPDSETRPADSQLEHTEKTRTMREAAFPPLLPFDWPNRPTIPIPVVSAPSSPSCSRSYHSALGHSNDMDEISDLELSARAELSDDERSLSNFSESQGRRGSQSVSRSLSDRRFSISDDSEYSMSRSQTSVSRVSSYDKALNLGSLVLGFLYYFGFSFDFPRTGIVLYPPWFFGFNKPSQSLVIMDPVSQPGPNGQPNHKNCGAGVFGMIHVRKQFQNIFRRLLSLVPSTLFKCPAWLQVILAERRRSATDTKDPIEGGSISGFPILGGTLVPGFALPIPHYHPVVEQRQKRHKKSSKNYNRQRRESSRGGSGTPPLHSRIGHRRHDSKRENRSRSPSSTSSTRRNNHSPVLDSIDKWPTLAATKPSRASNNGHKSRQKQSPSNRQRQEDPDASPPSNQHNQSSRQHTDPKKTSGKNSSWPWAGSKSFSWRLDPSKMRSKERKAGRQRQSQN
jgi:hypothetical protein